MPTFAVPPLEAPARRGVCVSKRGCRRRACNDECSVVAANATPEITTVSPVAKPCAPTVVIVTVVPASVALAIRLSLAKAAAWSTVAVGLARPDVPPALNVAVACALAFSVSGCACGMVPSGPEIKCDGQPYDHVKISCQRRSVSMIVLAHVAGERGALIDADLRRVGRTVWFVSTMKGSNVVVPPLVLTIVVAGVFVPHQLFVTVAVEWLLFRLLALAAVLPARRLKLMEKA